MKILALDLGKFNTMCCFFDTKTRKHAFFLAATERNFTGSPAVVKVLLDHGADPNLRDMRGKTALGWVRWNRDLDDPAKIARKQDVETLLLSHGGK